MRLSNGFRLRGGGAFLAIALLAVAIMALPAIGKDGSGSGLNGPRPAGTIESFEDGELVVALAKGGTISAKVLRRTKIRCGHHRDGGDRRRARRGGNDDPAQHDVGDDSPSGSGHDSGRRGHCNADDLVPGATVIRAEIVLTHGIAAYEKIALRPAA